MPTCWEEALSALYLGVTGRFRLTYEDRAIEAEDKLERLLRQLDRREESLSDLRARHKAEALSLRHDRIRARNKLMDYKRANAELNRISSYRETVLQHMDALKNTELNKSLIQTLQESSRTLRDLGVVDGVRQAEAVVHDVEASMMQVQELTSVLGTPMASLVDSTTYTTEDLDAELEQLLMDDSDAAHDAREPDSLGTRNRRLTRDTTISRIPASVSSIHADRGAKHDGNRKDSDESDQEEADDDDNDDKKKARGGAYALRHGAAMISETVGLS